MCCIKPVKIFNFPKCRLFICQKEKYTRPLCVSTNPNNKNPYFLKKQEYSGQLDIDLNSVLAEICV